MGTSVTVDGKVSGEYKNYSTTFEFPEIETLHPEIERLWAFAKIEDLQNRIDYFGEDADIEQAIIDVANFYLQLDEFDANQIIEKALLEEFL